LRMICYGHAGDGNLHCNILKADLSDDKWENELPAAIEEVFRLTVSLGGTISGEHGIGHVQRRYLPLAMSPAELEVQRRLKRALDPNGIFNPGKALPE
jgi:glycolate oxidase